MPSKEDFIAAVHSLIVHQSSLFSSIIQAVDLVILAYLFVVTPCFVHILSFLMSSISSQSRPLDQCSRRHYVRVQYLLLGGGLYMISLSTTLSSSHAGPAGGKARGRRGRSTKSRSAWISRIRSRRSRLMSSVSSTSSRTSSCFGSSINC